MTSIEMIKNSVQDFMGSPKVKMASKVASKGFSIVSEPQAHIQNRWFALIALSYIFSLSFTTFGIFAFIVFLLSIIQQLKQEKQEKGIDERKHQDEHEPSAPQSTPEVDRRMMKKSE